MSSLDEFTIVEGRYFKKACKKLEKRHAGLEKDLKPVLGILRLGNDIVLSPITIRSTVLGIIKKARVAMLSEKRGKSSGYRLYYIKSEEQKKIFLLFVYTHQQMDSLNEGLLQEILNDLS